MSSDYTPSDLDGLLSALGTGALSSKVNQLDGDVSSTYTIDLAKPIELHLKSFTGNSTRPLDENRIPGANKKVNKKLIFAPANEKPEADAIYAAESDTIIIYADNFKFVNDSTASRPKPQGASEYHENSRLTFENDMEIKSGVTVDFNHRGGGNMSEKPVVVNSGSMESKEVKAKVDNIGEDDKEALTEAVGGITSELPMEEQSDSVSEWANENKARPSKSS